MVSYVPFLSINDLYPGCCSTAKSEIVTSFMQRFLACFLRCIQYRHKAGGRVGWSPGVYSTKESQNFALDARELNTEGPEFKF